jgi:hypothetical protein
MNPYTGATDAGSYILFFKSNSLRFAINYFACEIIYSIDLNSERRPW